MHDYNLVAFMCCVMFAVSLTHGRRMRSRSAGCEDGTYQHEGKTCCLCPKGYRVTSDCTDTNGTKCQLCEDGTYKDHPNSDHSCQPCNTCNPNANMVMTNKCSLYSNTACTCKENHYCSSRGDLCKACFPCKTCEKSQVETPCTVTNNTVCKDEAPISKGAIAAAVLIPLFIFLVVCIYLYRRKKSKKDQSIETPPETKPLKDVADVDLNPFLPEIADVLGWKVMKRVAQRSGMNEATIEVHELNHPNDAREQTYGLLQAWYQRQGLNGSYKALIQTLHDMKERRKADDIQKIIGKAAAEAQPD